MASLKNLTKEQKCSVYMFMEEYDKSIPGSHIINTVSFRIRYDIEYDEIKQFMDTIKEEDRFTYAIGILKEVQNERLFRTLLNDCYIMLNDKIQFIGMDRYTEEYSKLRELFKTEFGYTLSPISEILPEW